VAPIIRQTTTVAASQYSGLDGAHALELCDLINGIDVIDALDAVQIALVNGIETQIARLTLMVGLASLSDLRAR